MGITQQIGASSLIKPGVIDNTAARPASPYEGQVIFQKDTDQLLVWNGTAWVVIRPTPAEQITVYTSGSGTYTVPTNCSYLKIRIVGGGGGGAGSGGATGAGNAGSGSNGGTSTFGSSLISATGGGGGQFPSTGGGVGGSGSISSPATGFVFGGVQGTNMGFYNTGVQVYTGNQGGPPTPLGAYGCGGANAGASNVVVCVGGTGGSAGYVEAVISSPSATYAYAVGAGGSGGAAGTSGSAGGGGGAGAIYITAYF
jgi:hypothetical protein